MTRDGAAGTAPLGRDPGLGAMIGALGERRRHARALARWSQARGSDRLPRLGAGLTSSFEGDTAAALFELIDGQARLIEADPCFERELDWADSLFDQLVSRILAVQAQPTPQGFEAEAWNGGDATAMRGVLLPFADDSGALRYVEAVVSWKVIVPPSEVPIAMLSHAALAGVEAPAGRIASGTVAERLDVARTWAALAATDPLSRAMSLHAALSALLDAVLMAAAAPLTALVDDVFGATCASSERRKLRFALLHATRLGLGAGELAPLLARYPDGIGGMARLELWVQRQERPARPGVERPTVVRVRLMAIEPAPRSADRRGGNRELGDQAPWGGRLTAAA